MAFALIVLAALVPTVAQVLQLPPAEAGELVLKDRQHRPIETVWRDEVESLRPPGQVTLKLAGQPEKTRHGCARIRWTANFQAAPGESLNSAVLGNVYGSQEVTLPIAGKCPRAGYVHLNPNVGAAQAFDGLSRLNRLRTGTWKPRLTCRDQTASRICVNDRSVRAALTHLSPWAVSRTGDNLVFWLGTPGQAVTEVGFDPAEPNAVTVERVIPAPA